MKRFFGLEKQLKKIPDNAVRYAKAIDQCNALGHARRLEPKELSGPHGRTWYLPHDGVEPNGKLRVVFDGSSRHLGQSLNNHLLQEPDLMNSDSAVWGARSLSGKGPRGFSRHREDVQPGSGQRERYGRSTFAEILRRGSFKLPKRLSSSKRILAQKSTILRIDPKLDLEMDELPSEKTLGIHHECRS